MLNSTSGDIPFGPVPPFIRTIDGYWLNLLKIRYLSVRSNDIRAFDGEFYYVIKEFDSNAAAQDWLDKFMGGSKC